jgi:hypothetical protein
MLTSACPSGSRQIRARANRVAGVLDRRDSCSVPDESAVPSPRLVAAWMRLDILSAETVPLWAAHWLIEGYDGDSITELAGLSGRDTRAVWDLLPAALEEADVPDMTSTQAETKVAFDHIASLHADGLASWGWVIDIVRETISQGGYAFEFFEQPLAAVYGLDDELEGGWGRAEEELGRAVWSACVEQLGRTQAR